MANHTPAKEMYESLLEQAADGIFVSDPSGRYVIVNDQACKMLDYTRQELLQFSITDLIPPEDMALVPIDYTALQAGNTVRIERRLGRKDSSYVWVEFSAKIIADGYLQQIARDITARKQMEDDLRRSEAKYRLLTEAMQDVVWTLDTETLRFTYVSPSVVQLNGYTPEEIMTQPLETLLIPEVSVVLTADLQRNAARFRQGLQASPAHFQNFEAFNFQIREVEQHCKNGATVWTEVVIRFYHNTETGHVEVLGVTRNIAERKRAEEHIRKLNRTLALVNVTNKAIIRIRTLPDLFDEICRIAVETGGLSMAWLGLFDPETSQVNPVAKAGVTSDYINKLDIRMNDPLRSSGPTGTVLRTGRHDVSNDIEHDPRMAPWRADALRLGYRASAVFPLKVNGQTRGTLNLYAQQSDFFNDEELALLDDMVADISFAMEIAEQESHRLNAEIALQEQIGLIEEMRIFLQTTLDAFPANTVVLDADGTIINVNQPWIRFNIDNSNSSPTDYLKQNYLTVCDNACGAASEEGAPVADGIRAVIAGQQEEFNYEYPCNSPSEERWFLLQVTPFPEAAPRRVVVAHLNITDRELAERKLQEAHDTLEQRVIERTAELQAAKQQVEAILNNNPASILLLSPDLQIKQTNPAFSRLFAAQADEYLNKHLVDLIPEADGPTIINAVQAVVMNQVEQRVEVHARRNDNTVIATELYIGFIPNGGLVCTINDITVRKQAEESLQKALIVEKELGELKTRFVSMASHEFRTPLATILATTDTLSAYWHKLNEDQIDQKLIKIKGQVDHLKAIMDDVLTLTRMQSRRIEFNPALLNLDTLCQNVIEEFQIQPDIHHQFQYACAGTVSDNMLDKKLMRQIISNLLSNAAKYSPSEKPVLVNLAFTTDTIVLSVADQGIGISENDQKHLFEPFHRAENVGTISGTGLGLVITKDAVEMHGGTITVASQLDVGTTITVHIPLSGDDSNGQGGG